MCEGVAEKGWCAAEREMSKRERQGRRRVEARPVDDVIWTMRNGGRVFKSRLAAVCRTRVMQITEWN